MEGLNFPEAIRQLGRKIWIEIEETESCRLEQQEGLLMKGKSLYMVLNFASEYFKDLLHNHPQGKSIGFKLFFIGKGFSKCYYRLRFDLGFTLDQWMA